MSISAQHPASVVRSASDAALPLLQPGWRVKRDKTGLWTGRFSYLIPADNCLAYLPAPFSAHPTYSGLFLDDAEIVGEHAGFARLDTSYAGMDPDPEKKEPKTEEVYSLAVSVGEEPISTHPRFWEIVEEAGGVVDEAWLEDNRPKSKDPNVVSEFYKTNAKAVFRDGVFVAFGAAAGEFQGLEAYLNANQVIWTARWTQEQRPPNLADAGFVDSPRGPAPALGTDRNWLNTGIQYEQKAKVFTCSESWRASGMRKLSDIVYG
jgi:hypothetical protein